MNHEVLIVGYGTESSGYYKGMEYFLIKNSWGDDWGNLGGYAKIAISKFSPGYCGL